MKTEPAPAAASRDRPTFPRQEALHHALALVSFLGPSCEQIEIVGSIRRHKAWVKDIELLYIPKHSLLAQPSDLFLQTQRENAAEEAINTLECQGVIARRLDTRGREAWGAKNKLARHLPSGIPLDLFAAQGQNWVSLLVCRTGPAEANIAIARRARALGWRWNPYDGLVDSEGRLRLARTEAEFFALLGLPCPPPEDRHNLARCR